MDNLPCLCSMAAWDFFAGLLIISIYVAKSKRSFERTRDTARGTLKWLTCLFRHCFLRLFLWLYSWSMWLPNFVLLSQTGFRGRIFPLIPRAKCFGWRKYGKAVKTSTYLKLHHHQNEATSNGQNFKPRQHRDMCKPSHLTVCALRALLLKRALNALTSAWVGRSLTSVSPSTRIRPHGGGFTPGTGAGCGRHTHI